MSMIAQLTYRELLEKIAAKVHEQWCEWQQFQDAVVIHGKSTVEFTNHTWEEWNRKAKIPYDKLKDHEKLSDKKIAEKIWLSLFVDEKMSSVQRDSQVQPKGVTLSDCRSDQKETKP